MRTRHTAECPACGQQVPIVNYAMEKRPGGSVGEAGYLGRHSRPGIARTSKCRGSFGGWVGRATKQGEHVVSDTDDCWCEPEIRKVAGT